MATLLPQVGSNLILTQLPYAYGLAYDTIVQEMETGMRWTFPRRAASLDGFPNNPLWSGMLNYPMVTDSEAVALQSFFDQMRGRWGRFGVLDPGGNLLQYSEDFTKTYWDKSASVSVSGSLATQDPFGRTLGSVLTGTGSNSVMSGIVGPSDGGMSGFVLNFSAYVNARSANQRLFFGFTDADLNLFGKTFDLPFQRWVRIDYAHVVGNQQQIKVVFGGLNSWSGSKQIYAFGLQCVPMKGAGGYVKTPYSNSGYGYHANCRFDTDVFSKRQDGPNQNAIQLPVVEVNA